MRWLVTGGAGFIGSCLVRRALTEGWADEVVVLDLLTYAGHLESLEPVAHHPGFRFVHGDTGSSEDVARALAGGADALFHLAAESHVDTSIADASAFVRTNVVGTQVVLTEARRRGVGRFVHVSTDEVYGALPLEGAAAFRESDPLRPTSPYAASKAASDLMALAAHRTHGLDVVVTRCSNNYGPFQHPEKFLPLFITHALDGRPCPLYGDGRHVRDWIHVDDHAAALRLALLHGKPGDIYNLGGGCERANCELAAQLLELIGADPNLLVPSPDRPAHDRRYAIDARHAARVLGFCPGPAIEARLPELIAWYRAHRPWWEAARGGPGSRPGRRTRAVRRPHELQ